MNATDEHLAYYLHVLAAHGGEYMMALGSLGKYMNEGVENHHKDSWRMMDHTFRGGTAGNPFTVKTEDGKAFVTSEGPTYQHTSTPMAEALMHDQNRLIYKEISGAWDSTLWEKVGKVKPKQGDFNSVKVQAPQVMAQNADRRLKEADKKLRDAKMALETNECKWPWIKPTLLQNIEKASATMQRAKENLKCWLDRCKRAGETNRLSLRIKSLADL